VVRLLYVYRVCVQSRTHVTHAQLNEAPEAYFARAVTRVETPLRARVISLVRARSAVCVVTVTNIVAATYAGEVARVECVVRHRPRAADQVHVAHEHCQAGVCGCVVARVVCACL
jgi:hypothetical protein